MFPVNITGEPVAPEHEVATSDSGNWFVPDETPTAFVYNRRNYAVMLSTPQDLVDYAVGFSLTERIIDTPNDILELDIVHSDRGIDLRIRISNDMRERFDIRQRRRNLPGNAGCGLCGLDNVDDLFAPLPIVAEPKVSLDPEMVLKAIESLSDHQPINRRTRSVHGAAWVSLSGDILHLREDVGRHNALDKLLGALGVTGTDMNAGFVLMSSRCSYELIEKGARRGVTAMAFLSGPTSFALRKAQEANMAIYARGLSGIVELNI